MSNPGLRAYLDVVRSFLYVPTPLFPNKEESTEQMNKFKALMWMLRTLENQDVLKEILHVHGDAIRETWPGYLCLARPRLLQHDPQCASAWFRADAEGNLPQYMELFDSRVSVHPWVKPLVDIGIPELLGCTEEEYLSRWPEILELPKERFSFHPLFAVTEKMVLVDTTIPIEDLVGRIEDQVWDLSHLQRSYQDRPVGGSEVIPERYVVFFPSYELPTYWQAKIPSQDLEERRDFMIRGEIYEATLREALCAGMSVRQWLGGFPYRYRCAHLCE